MKHAVRLLMGLLLCGLMSVTAFASEKKSTTVLFTHDLHSHFLPVQTADGEERGGYARLAALLEGQRELYPDALVLDAGDFSIGSLFQTLYTEQAAELRTMGAMGYDVVALGNHEFDHTGMGFGEMLDTAQAAVQGAIHAKLSAQSDALAEYDREYGPAIMNLPVVVSSNYWPDPAKSDAAAIRAVMENYGVERTVLLERGGVTYGIFALMGVDAHECAPTSGFLLEDRVKTAQNCVNELKLQGAEFIICLSHGGTDVDTDKSEDEQLAKAVEGIDLIVSGHTHTVMEQPLVVNDTYIVASGEYGSYLGSVTLEWDAGEKSLKEYRLIPVDETVEEEPYVASVVSSWKSRVSAGYLAAYGLSYDQVLTHTDFDLNVTELGVQQGNNLGELVADAYFWATKNLEADAPAVDSITVTADGVLRANLPAGELTTSMAFDVLSMGVGSDGTSGFPLVAVWLTGKELKAAAEVDASVTPIMPDAQLYMSGLTYTFNTNRMFFNRVTEIQCYQQGAVLGTEQNAILALDDDRLYRVVTGMYSAQMLGTVKSKSMGLLSLEPKMADGSPVTDFNACILRDEQGNEIKEWYALAAYLKSFGEEGVPQRYAESDGRKNVISSWNPVELLKNPNWITLTVLGIALLLLVGIVWGTRKLVFRCRKTKTAAADKKVKTARKAH